MITLWIAIQTLVDLLIIIAVIFYLYERKKEKKEEKQNVNLKKKETLELINSLDRLITESERSSINISDKVLFSQKKTQELVDRLEIKQKELQEETKKVESLLEKIKNPSETDSDKDQPLSSEEDKYSEAAKLAKNGLNVEEISKQLDLPKGEIELILDLPLRNAKKNERT